MPDFLAPVLPFQYQCGNWRGSEPCVTIRCPNSGDYWMVCPDGTLCPSIPFCEECAVRCVKEYAEKLDEWWSIEPLRLLAGETGAEWRYAA